MTILSNLQKAKLSEIEANKAFQKIDPAWEAGNFEEAAKLHDLYLRLTDNSNMWLQKQVNENKVKHGLK